MTIPNVSALDTGVWKAKLAPKELRFLSASATRVGSFSVLLLLDIATYDGAASTLKFNPANACLLNLGNSDNAIILESRTSSTENLMSDGAVMAEDHFACDAEFLVALPSALQELGTQLLRTVRDRYPGVLRFSSKSKKFVETPDNFWTVRIQPRNQSLRITVRGRPHEFSAFPTIELAPDMAGYSAFKLSSARQLPDLIRLFQQVPKKGRRA